MYKELSRDHAHATTSQLHLGTNSVNTQPAMAAQQYLSAISVQAEWAVTAQVACLYLELLENSICSKAGRKNRDLLKGGYSPQVQQQAHCHLNEAPKQLGGEVERIPGLPWGHPKGSGCSGVGDGCTASKTTDLENIWWRVPQYFISLAAGLWRTSTRACESPQWGSKEEKIWGEVVLRNTGYSLIHLLLFYHKNQIPE